MNDMIERASDFVLIAGWVPAAAMASSSFERLDAMRVF
jgi:hypothetical protein